MTSKIEWTDETDNPITVKSGGHWCRKISDGCKHCYAETINTGDRFDFASGLTYTGQAPELELNRKMLAGWARKRVPKRRFVCSMTDWCGEWIPREWQIEMIQAMAYSHNQTFMLLSKRADILSQVVNDWCARSGFPWLPSNIWLGVSVESQGTAFKRLDAIAAIKQLGGNTFVSFEPLLEEVYIGDYARYIDLAIVGAESGKGARPMEKDWVRSLRDEIKAANKAFFYKQNVVNGRKVSLPELDGKVWSELP